MASESKKDGGGKTQTLLSDLQGHIVRLNLKKASKSITKLLSIDPKDNDVLHCKVVSLINESKYQDAIDASELITDRSLAFEKAYALYCLNKSEESLKLIQEAKAAGKDQGRMRMLEGQLYYRLARYSEAADAYKDVLASGFDDSAEFRANVIAALVCADKAAAALEDKHLAPSAIPDSFDMAFNSACALAAEGTLDAATDLTTVAEKVCRETLGAEGLSAEEINDELAVVRVLFAYVLQKRGDTDNALGAYRKVLKSKPSDPAVVAVAANNLACLRGNRELFDSYKRVRAATQPAVTRKLTEAQREAVNFNHALIACYMGKAEEARALLQIAKTNHPTSPLQGIAEAAIVGATGDQAQARKALADFAEAFPDRAEPARVALAHLAATEGDFHAAADQVACLDLTPGSVATAAALYEAADAPDQASAIRKRAAKAWAGAGTGDAYVRVRIAEADAAIQRGDAAAAAALYKQVLAENTDLSKKQKALVTAGLVMALARTDPEEALKVSKSLQAPKAAAGSGELAPAALMAAVGVKSAPAPASAGAGEAKASEPEDPAAPAAVDPRAAGAAASAKARQAKKRAKKKAKYIEKLKASGKYEFTGIPKPDPERWIPKKDRAHARRRAGRKGANTASGGAQGVSTSTRDAAKLDMAARERREAEEKAKKPAVSTPKSKGGARRKKNKR